MLEVILNANILFYILAYLIGGIPFGFLLVKGLFKINILHIGSGGIGATNVYRALKDVTPHATKYAAATILLDSTKGLFIVLAAKLYGMPYETQWAIAILTVLGHCYSPYLKLHGGKGVSTTIGSTILLIPIEGIIGLFLWFIVGKVFRVSSLSSLIGVGVGILCSFVLPHIVDLPDSISITSQIGTHVPLVILLILIIYTHIPNIIRLIKKEESKIFE